MRPCSSSGPPASTPWRSETVRSCSCLLTMDLVSTSSTFRCSPGRSGIFRSAFQSSLPEGLVGVFGDTVYLGAAAAGDHDAHSNPGYEFRECIYELLFGEGYSLQHVNGRTSVVKPEQLYVEGQTTSRMPDSASAAADAVGRPTL